MHGNQHLGHLLHSLHLPGSTARCIRSVEWIEQLYQDGFTADCSADPLAYCPDRPHTHAEACVFFLRMLYGADYAPPAAEEVFADVDYENAWYGDWVDTAWSAGFVEPCATAPDLLLCPDDPLSRGEAASMMFNAKEED